MAPARLRYAGIAAVAVLWSTLVTASLLTRFPLLGPRPLSWLVADPDSSLLYSVGLAGGALLLVAFHWYVRARYPVSRTFSIAMLAGLAGQLIAAVVPIDGSPVVHRIHTVAALTLGASLPVLMWRFAVAQPPGPWRRTARRLFLLEAGACVVGVVLSRNSVAPLAEILPAASYHLWVVVLTVSSAGASASRSPGTLGTSDGGQLLV